MKFIYILLITCCFTKSIGQQVIKTTVEIDVRSGAFKTSVPFDETFNIKGELAYSTKKVILKYRPVDPVKEKKYFNTPRASSKAEINNVVNENLREYIVKNGETEFLFSEIGPLRPNIPYKFEFLTLAKNTLASNEIDFLRQELYTKLSSVLTGKLSLTVEEIDNMYDQLLIVSSEIISEADLVNSKNEPFKIDNYKKNLNLFSYRLLSLYNTLVDSNKGLLSVLDSTGTNSLSYNFNQIQPKLAGLAANSIPLSPYSKQIISLTNYKTAQGTENIRQTLKTLQLLVGNKEEFKQTVFNDITNFADSTEQTGVTTLNNFSSLLDKLTSSDLTKLDNSAVFTTNELNSINNISKSLNAIVSYQKLIIDINLQLALIKAKIASALVNNYTDNSYILASAAEFNVTPKYNPYVTLDAGIITAYNPYKNFEGIIGNQTYFSLYEGISVYFTPINKRVPLNSFKWPYNFYKALNVHIGVAQTLGGYNTYRYTNTPGGIGNLVIGLGIRFNSTAKINVNAVFVNMKDVNPIISQSKLRPMFGLGFTFDIGIAKLFSKNKL